MKSFERASLVQINNFTQEELWDYLFRLKEYTNTTGSFLYEQVLCDMISQNILPLDEQIIIYYYLSLRVFYNLATQELPYLLSVSSEIIFSRIVQEYENRYGKIIYIPKENRNMEIICFNDGFSTFSNSPSKMLFEQMEVFHDYFENIRLVTFSVLQCNFSLPFYLPQQCRELIIKNRFWPHERVYSLKTPGHYYPWSQYNTTSFSILEGLFYVFNQIMQMRPFGIYVFGNMTPIVSLIRRITDVCQIPTSWNLPYALSDMLFSSSKNWLAYKHAVRANCKVSVVNYVQSAPISAGLKKNKSRYEFSLPEEKFLVLIPSARLDSDVDNEFLRQLLCCANLDVVLMGNFIGWTDFIKTFSDVESNRIHYIGFVKEYMQVFRLCDLFVISPKSMGCGMLATYALEAGMACISLNKGDAYEVAFRDSSNNTNGLACESVFEMLEEIKNCCTSLDKLENRRLLGKRIYQDKCNMTVYKQCAEYFYDLAKQ